MVAWNPAIPSKALVRSWRRTPDQILDKFQPAVGEPIVGKQASSSGYTHSYIVKMNETQLQAMEAEWPSTFNYGVAEIDIPHPIRSGITFLGRLTEWNIINDTKNAYDVEFKVYELPS